MSVVLYDVPGPRARRRALIGSIIGTLVVGGIGAAVVWKLAAEGQFESDLWEPFTDSGYQEALLRGLEATVRAAVFAIILALVFGMVFALARLSERPYVRIPAVTVIEFFRSVPVLLMILFLYLGFADTFDEIGENLEDTLPGWLAEFLDVEQFSTMGPLVIALMLYNGSVLAEVFRAGILAVPKGQAEAAYALGLRKSQVMWLILVPQAVRIMLPAIVSQVVVALKDTALGFIIGYQELVRTGRLIYDQNFNIIPTAIVIAVIFIILNMSLSRFAVWLEKRQRRKFGAKVPVEVTEVETTMGQAAGPV